MLIVNGNGKPVVMISLDDYNNLDETSYLLSNKYNASALKESIAALSKKKIVKKALKDLTVNTKK
jgi:antitoxin YefM